MSNASSYSDLDLIQGYHRVAAALRTAEHLELADFVLMDAMQRFADSSELAAEYAWVAHHRHDWQTAAERWSAVRKRFPDISMAYWMEGALLLKHLYEFDKAEDVLREGVRRFPEHVDIAIGYAELANAKESWSVARERWRELAKQYPEHPAIREGASKAVYGQAMEAVESGIGKVVSTDPTLTAQVGKHERRDRANLMSRFISIGENCEFGLIQRHFGAEPLDLLRWNAIKIDALIKALDNRFEGVGERSNTALTVHNGEYVLHDHRYGMVMHTFLDAAAQRKSAQQIEHDMCNRAEYLKEKLIQDLCQAERIFVYKSYPSCTSDSVENLLKSLNRYGPNTLLYVAENEGQQPGVVQHIGDKLFLSCLDRAARTDQDWSSLPFGTWANICSQVAAAVDLEESR